MGHDPEEPDALNDPTLLEDEFLNALLIMEGEVCWAATAVGAWIKLDIGKKIRRDRPIHNPHLPNDLMNYKGSLALDFQCYWELHNPEGVVLTYEDCDLGMSDGEIGRIFQIIVDRKITSIILKPEKFDLLIVFENGCRIFLMTDDPLGSENAGYNYIIYLQQASYLESCHKKLKKTYL